MTVSSMSLSMACYLVTFDAKSLLEYLSILLNNYIKKSVLFREDLSLLNEVSDLLCALIVIVRDLCYILKIPY